MNVLLTFYSKTENGNAVVVNTKTGDVKNMVITKLKTAKKQRGKSSKHREV